MLAEAYSYALVKQLLVHACKPPCGLGQRLFSGLVTQSFLGEGEGCVTRPKIVSVGRSLALGGLIRILRRSAMGY